MLWEQLVTFAQQGLTDASRRFQLGDCVEDIPVPQPGVPSDTSRMRVALRDVRGNFIATTVAGEIVYQNPVVDAYTGPMDAWIMDGGEIIRRERIDSTETWWLHE
jgi:hypothetical protein